MRSPEEVEWRGLKKLRKKSSKRCHYVTLDLHKSILLGSLNSPLPQYFFQGNFHYCPSQQRSYNFLTKGKLL
jgi:hypothetical protein